MPTTKKAPAKKTAPQKQPMKFPQVPAAMQSALTAGRFERLGRIATAYSEFLDASAQDKRAVMKRRYEDLQHLVSSEFTHDVDAKFSKKHDALMSAGRDGKYDADELSSALKKLRASQERAREKALAAAGWA